MRRMMQQSRATAHGSALRALRPSRTASIGNQARLRRLVPDLQAKLTVGAVNDPLEREADRAADRVMRMPDAGPLTAATPLRLSRKCAECDEADKAHGLQAKALPSPDAATADEAPAMVHDVLRSPGQALDARTRGFFQPRFGYDFSGVRVHADGAAAQSAQAVGALAYTVGNHVVLGTNGATDAVLAHELAHVVQQGGATPGGAQALRRQADPALDINMPAFPCDFGAGVVLCNTTKDSTSAPNFADCMKTATDIIDGCKGDKSDCLSRAKCALCQCLGKTYCPCTGIV